MNISLKIFNVQSSSSLLLTNCDFKQQLLHNFSRFCALGDWAGHSEVLSWQVSHSGGSKVAPLTYTVPLQGHMDSWDQQGP